MNAFDGVRPFMPRPRPSTLKCSSRSVRGFIMPVDGIVERPQRSAAAAGKGRRRAQAEPDG